MAAWQYFAGAGLVAVCCPLHGQVAVADTGAGPAATSARAEARADVCVPEGPPRAPAARPPAVRPPAVRPPEARPPQVRPPAVRTPAGGAPGGRHPGALPGVPGVPGVPGLPGADRPTVHHPGLGPVPAAAAPGLPAVAAPAVAAPAGAAAGPPAAKALAAAAEPPAAAPDPAAVAGPPAAAAGAPPAHGARAAQVSAFHVRPYRSQALARREPGGMSTVMIMAVVTTPAVLAAAALRPRSKSRSS
ncbi:hypothetical protein [Streptomyces sp. NPDC007369]|uniref:hypothetical protein n=1 Tax=Streptomyces sp. NPDC007369 TaxID=3154589 RepID=UPI0033CF9F2C